MNKLLIEQPTSEQPTSEQPTSEPKVKAYIPMYEPLKTETCKKCGKLITEPKELIRIVKENQG